MMGSSAARLAGRTVIALEGEEASDFLQGLVTVDLRELGPRRSLWGALLNPQGRYLFDFFLYYDRPGRLLMECESQRAPDLLRRLQLYRLRRQIAIAEEPGLAVLASDAPPSRFGLGEQRGESGRAQDAIVAVDPRLASLGLRLLLPPAAVAAFLATYGLREVPATVFERRRLELGVFEGSSDLLPERSLPLECNFAELGGISFEKGCYVGQEVTARMHFRARPRRRLLPARFPAGAPQPGAIVETADGMQAGSVVRVASDIGLVLVRVEHLGRPDAQPLRADGREVEPWVPPWLGLKEKIPLQGDADEA